MRTYMELAKEYHCTRQNIEQYMKRVMKKLFMKMTLRFPNEDAFELCTYIAIGFGLTSQEEYRALVHDFPRCIRQKIIRAYLKKTGRTSKGGFTL